MAVARLQPVSDAALPADDDAHAVSQASHGDRRAFEQLYRRHAGWVYGLCLRLSGQRETAEDCTQECFVAAWRALPGFEQRSRFATWLHRIAVNTVLARRRAMVAPGWLSAEEHSAEVLATAGASDAAGPIDVERAITRLPRGARDVLVLVGVYGYSHDEASAMLGIAVGTCKAQLHRARALLASHLGLAREKI